MKIEISLAKYNKLKIKEELLNQLAEIKTPTNDSAILHEWYVKVYGIIFSLDALSITEYNDDELLDQTITLSKKVYDYYLFVQMVYSQIRNTKCDSAYPNKIVTYHNTITNYTSTFKKIVKKSKEDIEEFNTLVKLASEKTVLKKKNIELEAKLGMTHEPVKKRSAPAKK
jgi:hypothetical protein